jgi:integrase
MSIHARTVPAVSVHERRAGGYEVRWTEGGRQRSRTLKRKRDAERLDARIKEAKTLGQVGLAVPTRETLDEFGTPWLERHQRHLAKTTRLAYLHTWNVHVVPFIGDLRLGEITPSVVAHYRDALVEDGVGAATVRKALAVLSACMTAAVLDGKAPLNPVAAVRKPQATVQTERRLVAVDQIERLRHHLADDGRAHDAVLVALLAYAGVRPEEALALRWEDIGQQTIWVQRAVQLGEAKATKTRRARHVDLLTPLRDDLTALRDLTNGRARDLLWARAKDGRVWQDHDYRNWRRRLYQPLAAKVGIEDRRPYSLRHGFASLLIASGRTLVEVAAQLGHGPDVCARTYAREFAEYRGGRIDPEAVITTARRGADLRDFFATDPEGTSE